MLFSNAGSGQKGRQRTAAAVDGVEHVFDREHCAMEQISLH